MTNPPPDVDTIWVVSTRDPDGKPVCEINWGAKRYYAPVADVRQTALDLVTCAAYAEMMMKLAGLGLPAAHVSAFTSDLLAEAGRTMFGTPRTVTLLPAGSTKRREALVVIRRGSSEGMVSPGEARNMALQWLEAAEATESDQFVAEALRATRIASDTDVAQLFGYLRELRS
jgi:hypothetical protein